MAKRFCPFRPRAFESWPYPRAPTSFDPRDRDAKRQAGQSGGSYDCAEADVYETTKHSTKKGDPASHKIAMVAPPDVECW